MCGLFFHFFSFHVLILGVSPMWSRLALNASSSTFPVLRLQSSTTKSSLFFSILLQATNYLYAEADKNTQPFHLTHPFSIITWLPKLPLGLQGGQSCKAERLGSNKWACTSQKKRENELNQIYFTMFSHLKIIKFQVLRCIHLFWKDRRWLERWLLLSLENAAAAAAAATVTARGAHAYKHRVSNYETELGWHQQERLIQSVPWIPAGTVRSPPCWASWLAATLLGDRTDGKGGAEGPGKGRH